MNVQSKLKISEVDGIYRDVEDVLYIVPLISYRCSVTDLFLNKFIRILFLSL